MYAAPFEWNRLQAALK